MSKKLVIPTLETQQKYPLFYAEATKTINDIIEHISKERGIYTSDIEPDPKEHTIWFNTNFNILYFYSEKTKSFIPINDLSDIIALITDLRKEIGDDGDWNNDGQYNTVYAALDGLQTQIQNINFTIIPIYTVSNKNELFDMHLSCGVYKIEEYDGNTTKDKHYYILTVGDKTGASTHKLYGSNGIFEEKTIDGIKQFVPLDLNTSYISEIIGSGNFGSNLGDVGNITDAINILSSMIGELDNKIKTASSLIDGGKITHSYKRLERAMEHPIVKNLPAGTYNISINVSKTIEVVEPFRIGSIVIRNTNRKVLSYYPSNNIPLNLQFSQPVNIYVTPLDKDYLDRCLAEDGSNFLYDGESFLPVDVDYTFDNIWVIPTTDVSDIKDRLDIIEDTILSNSEFIEVNYEGNVLIENNKKYKINNKKGFSITKNSDEDDITNFTILSIYSTPPTFEEIPILGFSDAYTYEEVVLLEYNNGYITVSKILEKGDVFTTQNPINIFDPEIEELVSVENKLLDQFIVTNVEKANVKTPILFVEGGGDIIIPPNYIFTNIPENYHIDNLILYGSYEELDFVPYGDGMNLINNLIVYSRIDIDNMQAYVERYIIGNGGRIIGSRIFNKLQLSSFTINDENNGNIIPTENEVILTNCSANIDNYMFIAGFSSPTTVAYFGNNTDVYISMNTGRSIVRIFENIPENLTIYYNEECSIEFYTKLEHIEEFKTIIKAKYPNTNILDNISFYDTEFVTRQNGLFKETVAINKGNEIGKYIHV